MTFNKSGCEGFNRASGVLVHPSSLPGDYGIGDFGDEAFAFIDFLKEARQSLWQVLPLGPTLEKDFHSPYSSYSALGGNPLLISPVKLYREGLLTRAELGALKAPRSERSRIDYRRLVVRKEAALQRAFDRLRSKKKLQAEFRSFRKHNQWVDDLALFATLSHKTGLEWHEWGRDLRTRRPEAIRTVRTQLASEIDFHAFAQFLFARQWSALRAYAQKQQIALVGDVPIYVSGNSVDVWCNQDLFMLDRSSGKPLLVSGVPPDQFAKTGQLWNHPVYRWSAHRTEKYRWWTERFKALFEQFDLVRIDHFRGFEAFWGVPGGAKTAQFGKWYKAPGIELFSTLKKRLGRLPVLVEDLGVITPEVEHLRDSFGFPGTKVLQFAFDSGSSNPHLPINYLPNAVVGTGSHDLPSVVEWFKSRPAAEKRWITDYVGGIGSEGIARTMLRLAMSSVARLSINPLQDVLGLGIGARMNFPGTATWNNWSWRAEKIDTSVIPWLAEITSCYGRAPQKKHSKR